MYIFNLNHIQKEIRNQKLDGWLFYFFEQNDPIAMHILQLSERRFSKKRWFYFIPASGVPRKLVHSIDHNVLDYLPGKKELYFGWQELHDKLGKFLQPGMKVAAQYSQKNMIPYVSRIDAGTFEFLKSLKIRLVSSANLAQLFEIILSKSQLNSHITAAKYISNILFKSFDYIKKKLKDHTELKENAVKIFIEHELNKKNMITECAPVVATAENTANPFYKTSEFNNDPVHPGKLVFIEISGKLNEEHAVYAKMSYTGFTGETVPKKYEQKFQYVVYARDEALKYIVNGLKRRRKVKGFQVDEYVRNLLEEKNVLNYYIHRTGHSLGTRPYDSGVNLDNMETRDERQILNSICLVIEPGIYLSGYGFRSSVSAYFYNAEAHIYTQPVQNEIYLIMK